MKTSTKESTPLFGQMLLYYFSEVIQLNCSIPMKQKHYGNLVGNVLVVVLQILWVVAKTTGTLS
ncbi:hypothetical protein MAR_036288 [Mya arenaria]|uniref:Uncharacterized protein n=1 Tax=Mya arenaria TaxID=6604 RepID=A0ABY7EMJ1_MYAAR|nr:hypothetical protein MAR_036288 [Mya arenaria]